MSAGRRLVLAGLVIMHGLPVQASDPDHRPDQALSIEPLGVVFARTIGLEYEHGFGGIGLFGGVVLTLGDLTTTGPASLEGMFQGAGFNFGVRLYPWTRAPAGPFFGPASSVSWGHAEAAGGSQRGSSTAVGWSLGAVAGWTWLLGRSFELSIGLGLAYGEIWLVDTDATKVDAGPLPLTRLAVGAAF